MTRGGVRLLAIVVLLSLLYAPTRAVVPQQRPFGWGRADISGPFSLPRLRTWLNAVRGHEPGTMDVYARAIAVWNEGDVAGAVTDFDAVRVTLKRRGTSGRVPRSDVTVNQALQALQTLQTPGLSPSEPTDDDIPRRAAMLHTDIATAIAVEAGKADWATTVFPVGWHLKAALSGVEWVSLDAPRDPFVRQWYLAVAAFLQWRHEIESAPTFIEHALSLFPSDRDLLMISGCVHEYLASPRIQDGTGVALRSVGDATGHLRQAEKAYRQAIAQGASPELSMRLGRVLGLLGRHEEAVSRLKPALEVAVDVRLLYFINLFIGDEEAALDHDDLARQAYLRAQALFPSAASAHLALSRLARRADDRLRAAEGVRRLLALDAERVDPWADYYDLGHRALADQFLFDLRAPFRKAATR